MGLDPSMRASDDDREQVAERLRDAHAEGRLTMAEFQDRLDATYAAKTLGELVPVTQDLPAPTPRAPAVPQHRPGMRGAWTAWGTAVVITVGIWVTTSLSNGHRDHFWPIWVAGPWGAVLLARTLFGSDHERPGRRDGERDHR